MPSWQHLPLGIDRYTSESFFDRTYSYVDDAITAIDEARDTIAALDVTALDVEDPQFENIGNVTIDDIDVPDVPDLLGLPAGNTPTKPTLVSGTLANTNTITTLIDTLNNSLIARLTQATAMDPGVELAIYNRARDREAINAQVTIKQITTEWTSRGFSTLPGKAFDQMQEEAIQKGQNAVSAQNREILIQQSQLEQDNIKFTLTQLQAFQAQLLQAKQAYENNAIRFYEIDWQAYINNINIIAALNKTTIDLYQSQIEQYKARTSLEAEKARVLIERLKALNEKNNALAQFSIEKVKYLSSFDISKFQTKVKAWEAIGSIQGQLCSTAMNSINISNNFGYGIHYSGSESHSYSGE